MTDLDQKTPQKLTHSLRLIVHIGVGKTGTTSIQNALRIQQKKLIQQGIWYLGLMLENAPVKRYSWQNASNTFEKFASLNDNEITDQLTDVLLASADTIIESGCNTVILSNESFFPLRTSNALIRAFEFLVTQGWEVEVIAYVRRHDAWLKSAYTQWGLKHKPYQGSLLPFSKWVSKRSPLYFSNCLHPWINAKGCKTIVRNFDAIDDVVEDFYVATRIPQQRIVNKRDNQSVSPEELLLRSLFNNQMLDPVPPVEFNRLMNVASLNFNLSATTFLADYLPTDEDLMKVIDDCSKDRAKINRILSKNGQPPIDISPLKTKPVEIDLAKLTALMFQVLANQARKIELMESKLNKLDLSNN